MKWLTRQEVQVIGIVLALLLTGCLVKHYRASHSPAVTVVKATP